MFLFLEDWHANLTIFPFSLKCLILLKKLKDLCEHKTKVFNDRISRVRDELNPPQVIKLLMWIERNTELLSKACPGWGSEQRFVPNNSKADETRVKNGS